MQESFNSFNFFPALPKASRAPAGLICKNYSLGQLDNVASRFQALAFHNFSTSLHRLPDQGVCLALPLSSMNSFSPLQCFLNLSTLMPSHLFSVHSWKSHFCFFLAIFHFFLFLLLFNCEKYFPLQEKCPYALSELDSCCSLFAKSCIVVFNVHPEMSVPFHIYGGRNLFDVIYETSCGWGPSHFMHLFFCSTSAIK